MEKPNKIYRIDYQRGESDFATTLNGARSALKGWKKVSDLDEENNEVEQYVLYDHPVFADNEARIVSVAAF